MASVTTEVVDVPQVPLGSAGLVVSAQGLGCMGMSSFYGPPKPDADMIELIRYAIDRGVTFLDTSDAYGPHTNEVLVGKAIEGRRDKVQIATKFGLTKFDNFGAHVRGDAEYVRSACEASLQRLNVDYIDLYYQHRVDTTTPIEITVGEMKKLVEEGKVKYLGLSEASAQDIRRAHAVHPITAVQIEYSLWTRDVEEEIIPTCRELGIGIVPYSPLGRGFFAGYKPEETQGTDVRKMQPRMQGENLEKNNKLREHVEKIAELKNCSLNQLALAWVHHKGSDIVPIPGTTKKTNLASNVGALGVSLTKADMDEIEAAVSPEIVAGPRKPEIHLKDSWQHAQSPPLHEYNASSTR